MRPVHYHRQKLGLLRDLVAARACQEKVDELILSLWRDAPDLGLRSLQVCRRLESQSRYEEALRLALSNWKVQREPRDARVVLDAALAARRLEAAQPVLAWMARSRIEDWYLQRASERINTMKKGAP